MERRGFTLIELIVVVAIISLIGSIVVAALSTARFKAADAVRLASMNQMIRALDLYYQENGLYPNPSTNDCGGWDVGNQAVPFLSAGVPPGLPDPPEDPAGTDTCSGFRYYRYPAGTNGCDASRGAFYVMGVTNMETVAGAHPQSPGWSCPTRNWQSEMEWVTGKFEH